MAILISIRMAVWVHGLLRLEKLSDLNDIYKFQDIIILCKIFENRAAEMMKKILCNPRKGTSASSLSGCMRRFLLNAIIGLPTQAEIVDFFKQTLIGSFSLVNATLAFDSIILLPKNSQNEPKENLKLIYKIKEEVKNIFVDKRTVTKILKMDENNQYGNAMTKPLSTGSLKKAKKIPTMREFDLIIQSISDQAKIGHLFVVDIKFHQKNADEKQLFFNEIYSPIFEKKRCCLRMKDLFFYCLKQ